MTLIWLVALLIVVSEIYSTRCDINVTDPTFKHLPAIFRIDDEVLCKKNGNSYCKLSIVLLPAQNRSPSASWTYIQATIDHSKFYNHNELFHAVCVENFCSINKSDSKSDISRKLSECYNVIYEDLGLQVEIKEINCNEEGIIRFAPKLLDIIVLAMILSYLGIVLMATYIDHRRNTWVSLLAWSPTLFAFSLKSNWKKLCSSTANPHFGKLTFIQGIRFYNMLLIIFCHTVCSYIGGYVKNTEYFELVYRNQIRSFIITWFVFLVQTFFLISAFLLSHHVCQSMDVYQGSKLKYICVTFLNRYLRILPPVLVMITLSSTIWLMGIFQGPIKELYVDREYERCRKNWWTNILFINNYYHADEMCYLLTWYLAADTQLYLLSLLIMMIIWKFRQKLNSILTGFISFGVIVPMVYCYKYDLDIVYRLTPENSKNDNYRSFAFNAVYSSTYANMASYMIGLALGCIYSKISKQNLHNKYPFLISLFYVLPITVVYVSSFDYTAKINILLSGLVKICYAMGIGAGLLAMAQQNNGLIKKICEVKSIVFLANFTYSTYIVQYGIVFYRTLSAKEPLYFSDYILVTSFLKDAVLSIFCGFLMHIIVEMPLLQLQKMYVPQISRKRVDDKLN